MESAVVFDVLTVNFEIRPKWGLKYKVTQFWAILYHSQENFIANLNLHKFFFKNVVNVSFSLLLIYLQFLFVLPPFQVFVGAVVFRLNSF